MKSEKETSLSCCSSFLRTNHCLERVHHGSHQGWHRRVRVLDKLFPPALHPAERGARGVCFPAAFIPLPAPQRRRSLNGVTAPSTSPKPSIIRRPTHSFGDPNIELVVVCSRNHEEFVEGALNAGKHGTYHNPFSPLSLRRLELHEKGESRSLTRLLFCSVVVEKPFVNTSQEADRLIKLAQEKGKILTVFHSTYTALPMNTNWCAELECLDRRYDSDCRTLHQLLEKGALGDVRDAEIHFDFPNPGWMGGWTQKYQPGQGMAFGLGELVPRMPSSLLFQHDPHLTRPKEPIRSIKLFICLGSRHLSPASLDPIAGGDSDIDDTFTIILQYGGDKKNLVVTIKTAIITHLKDQLKFFVRGTEGTYLKVSPVVSFPLAFYTQSDQEERAVWLVPAGSQSHGFAR